MGIVDTLSTVCVACCAGAALPLLMVFWFTSKGWEPEEEWQKFASEMVMGTLHVLVIFGMVATILQFTGILTRIGIDLPNELFVLTPLMIFALVLFSAREQWQEIRTSYAAMRAVSKANPRSTSMSQAKKIAALDEDKH